MSWLGAEWHKIVIGILAIDRLMERAETVVEKLRPVEKFVERRYHQRRKPAMDLKDVMQDVELIKQLLPEIEAFYVAGRALFEKVEAVKAAKAQAAGAPPTGLV